MLALALALAMQASPTPGPPELILGVRPVLAVWHGEPVTVTARVAIDDPERELACPEIVVEWGDGSKSGNQSFLAACDPYAVPAGTPTEYRLQRMHKYRWPGTFSVVACVLDVLGECRRELRARRVVHIKGPDPEIARKWAGR